MGGAWATLRHLKRKGALGADSYNARLGSERLGSYAYASFNVFMEVVDILASSGIPVDTLSFSAHPPLP